MKLWRQLNIWILILVMVLSILLPTMESSAATTRQEEATVTATVPVSGSSYYVMIPENIDFGKLDATQDYVMTYEIDVSGMSDTGSQVKVTAPKNGVFYLDGDRDSKHVLPYTNSYGTKIFEVGTKTYGTIRIAKEDIAKAVSGSYSGNVIFTVTDPINGDGNNPGTDNPGGNTGGEGDDSTKTVETTVNLMQYTDISQKSMCDPLFYDKATLTTRSDGNVDVEMYLIDPIPGFAATDPVTPLSRLYITGSGSDLNFPSNDRDSSAQINLNPASGSFAVQAGIDKTTSYNKEYDPYSVYILKKGTYPSRKVTFTVPLSAVQHSASGKIVATTYVDAVMDVWKQFYIVFGDVSDLTGTGGGTDSGNNGSGDNGNTGTGGNGNTGTGGSGSSGSGSGSAGTGSGSTGTGSGSGSSSSTKLNNSNYSASVSIRQATDLNSISMCNPLFYSKADLTVNGDMTKVTMYVIDPIPNYPDEGTPLYDIVFQANGSSYNASLDSQNQVSRAYPAASGFISEAGNYYSDPITVTIPTSAVESSASGSILCSAYVNAVMKSTQKFYVVFSDLTEGEQTSSSGEAETITGGSSSAGGNSANGNNAASKNGTASGDNVALGESVDSIKEPGEYTADISMRKSTDIKEESMCDPLFYQRADLHVEGDNAEVKIYLINPIPQYKDEGTPLKDIVVKVNGTEYKATLEESNPVSQYFDVASGFITEAGEYDTAVITTTIPVDAIEKSEEGTILCSAYINAVMKTTQEFYMVFTDFRTGTTQDKKEDTEATGDKTADSSTKAAGDYAETFDGGSMSNDSEEMQYQLVTDAAWQGVLCLAALTGLVSVGILIWRKKYLAGRNLCS